MQTKQIQSQMKSIRNIGKITKTMEMVSVAKMRRTQLRAVAGRAYTDEAHALLGAISDDARTQHPLIHLRVGAPTCVVILIGSDKGLAGGFNVQLQRELIQIQNENGPIHVYTIGKHADRIARRANAHIVASFGLTTEALELRSIATLVDMVTAEYINDASIESIRVLSQKLTGPASTAVMFRTIIPFAQLRTNASEHTGEYTFEPDTQTVITRLLSGVIQSTIIQYVLESQAAEHTARMVAMKNASDNAGALYSGLVLSYNKARQAAITQEISEIVGGANALQN